MGGVKFGACLSHCKGAAPADQPVQKPPIEVMASETRRLATPSFLFFSSLMYAVERASAQKIIVTRAKKNCDATSMGRVQQAGVVKAT